MSDPKAKADDSPAGGPNDPEPPSAKAGQSMPMRDMPRASSRPAVEVELVHEIRSPPYVDRPWRMLEIWTQNRIYAINCNMICIDVIDQANQKSDPGHRLLGAKLVGGQHREGDTLQLAQPFPRPGTEAVFEQATKSAGARFSQSSTVARVVLRLRQVTISSGSEIPTWDEILDSNVAGPMSKE